MFRKLLLLLIVAFFAFAADSQTTSKITRTADEEKLEEKAVVFLRETLAEVNNMRTLENRISFTSELASLMWFHDEREARAMFGGLTNDFRQLLSHYDAQMNSLGTKPDDESGAEGFVIFDQSERTRLERKFRTAIGVRQQIAMSMAEHDPDLAFTFYYDSLNAISNPGFRKQTEEMNRYLEFQLINQVADKAPDRAAKFGSKSLAGGFSYQHVELLKKIYAKDQDRAIDFGADILSRVKSEKLKADEMWSVSSLISFGDETLTESRTDGKKKAVYSQSDLRDLAEVLAQSILDRSTDEGGIAPGYLKQIEKYAPGRVVQIKAMFKQIGGNDGSINAVNMVRPMNTSASAANAASNSAILPAERARQEREKNEKQMMDDVMKIDSKELPKEQRDSIIAQARKILVLAPGRDKKVGGLSMLAAQVAKAGDKELANQIMKDAESLVNPQPKNYQDFMLTWMLATGYASVNPDKAFPILQETIGRANETLAALVKVGEFIDTNEEIIQDGEVQVGAFGGSMVSGMTRELGAADSTIRLLTRADFDKTKDLTDRFDRPEIRILAKMMVLRSVLGADKNETKMEAEPGAIYDN